MRKCAIVQLTSNSGLVNQFHSNQNIFPTTIHRIYAEKRNKNAYDIDNIVIPYSMAASNRVEVLSYKEIPTPK